MSKLNSNNLFFILKRTLKQFAPEIRNHRKGIALSFLALLAEVAFRLLEPWPLKFVFDHVIPMTAQGTAHPLIQRFDTVTIIVLASIAVVVFSSLRAYCDYLSTIGFSLSGNRILTAVRSRLYSHIQCLPLSFHTKSRAGDLLIRVISDIGMLQDVIVTAFLPLLGNIFVLLGMLVVMFFINGSLALISLMILPLFWIVMTRRTEEIQQVSRKQRKAQSDMAAAAAESVYAIKTVQALSLEDVFKKNFTANSQQDLKQGVKAKRLSAGLERTVDVLIAIATSFILLIGACLIIQNQLTVGDLIVFMAYFKNAFKPLQNFAKYIGRIAKGSAASERILDIIELTPQIRNLPGAITAPRFKGEVEFKNVDFSYEDEQPILRSIDFIARPGDCVAIVAPSGTGKTTLVNLILRLYDPQQGEVKIDGCDIRQFTIESLRSQISIVLQDTLLFASSVRENIACGSSEVSNEEVESAARLANAHEFIMGLPQGYDTILGEKGATLSNGQRQRISIARAAIRQSPILILDEPTTGLDKENEREVLSALEKLSSRCTTFLITHSLNLNIRATLIVCLENGKIVEQGRHQELLNNNGSYARMFHAQDISLNKV